MSEKQLEYCICQADMCLCEIDNSFNPEKFGTADDSFNGTTIYRHNTFKQILFGKNSQGLWVIHRNTDRYKFPDLVFKGIIENNLDAQFIFRSVSNGLMIFSCKRG